MYELISPKTEAEGQYNNPHGATTEFRSATVRALNEDQRESPYFCNNFAVTIRNNLIFLGIPRITINVTEFFEICDSSFLRPVLKELSSFLRLRMDYSLELRLRSINAFLHNEK
jgi:hypothetical protein